MDDEERRYALAAALRHEIEERGITQAELGAELAHVQGRKDPYSQSYVSDFTKARRPISPGLVFDLERALKLRPGTLSRAGGYVPLEAAEGKTVRETIERAAELEPSQREDLLAVYEGMVARTAARRAQRRQRTAR